MSAMGQKQTYASTPTNGAYSGARALRSGRSEILIRPSIGVKETGRIGVLMNLAENQEAQARITAFRQARCRGRPAHANHVCGSCRPSRRFGREPRAAGWQHHWI